MTRKKIEVGHAGIERIKGTFAGARFSHRKLPVPDGVGYVAERVGPWTLSRDARDGGRSRLFRNDDAPASRIAEGLHCASAARVSSTQPPRAASPNSAPRDRYTTPVRVSFLLLTDRGCTFARVRVYLYPACLYLAYMYISPVTYPRTPATPFSFFFPSLLLLRIPSLLSSILPFPQVRRGRSSIIVHATLLFSVFVSSFRFDRLFCFGFFYFFFSLVRHPSPTFVANHDESDSTNHDAIN